MTQRVILSLLLLLFCGSGAAERPHKTVAVHPSASPKDVKTAPAPSGPANRLFGAVTSPAPLDARAIGSYARGCLAGGVSLPITGPEWQVMRLSRNLGLAWRERASRTLHTKAALSMSAFGTKQTCKPRL